MERGEEVEVEVEAEAEGFGELGVSIIPPQVVQKRTDLGFLYHSLDKSP